MIVLGRYGDPFAKNLSKELQKYRENISYHPYNYTIFPNGEPLIRIADEPYMEITMAITKKGLSLMGADIRFPPTSEKIRKKIKKDPNVILVIRGASGSEWRPVHEVWNAWVTSKYLKEEMDAEKVYLLLPNMPFGKQDKLFYDEDDNLVDGAPITVRYARELLREYADLLVSFNPHDFRDKTGWIKKSETTIPGASKDKKGRVLDEKGRVILPEAEDWTGFAYAINAMPLLVKYVLNSLENPYVIGPDQSIKNAIETACPEIKVKYAEKHRDRNESLEVESKIELPDMKGYDAVLFDDTIQAGTTMYNVVEEVKKRNPKSITCAAVHGEFVFNKKLGKSAYDLLKEAGADIVVTNTIRTPVSKVDVVPLLVKKLCSAKLLK